MSSHQTRIRQVTLSHAIGDVSISWSAVEMAMGLVLRELLDVDQITALAVSVSMDYAKRRDLMNSLAALKLSQSKVAYNDAMSAISGLSKERNAIIHGLYGYIDGQDVRLNINNRGSFTGTENKESVNRIM